MMRLCTLLVLAAAVSVQAAWAQSLADVARKEEERRKAVKGEVKVYTNDDLGLAGVPPPPQPADPADPPEEAPAAQPQAPEPPPLPEDERKTEAYWRGRIEDARAQLQRSEMFLEALQSRVNALTADFTARDDPAQRATIAEDRQRTLAEMERVKQEIERLRKEIADIQEEARRAGIPPGWLR